MWLGGGVAWLPADAAQLRQALRVTTGKQHVQNVTIVGPIPGTQQTDTFEKPADCHCVRPSLSGCWPAASSLCLLGMPLLERGMFRGISLAGHAVRLRGTSGRAVVCRIAGELSLVI